MPVDRSRIMYGTDRQVRLAATARPDGPAPMMIGPWMKETSSSGIVFRVVAIGSGFKASTIEKPRSVMLFEMLEVVFY